MGQKKREVVWHKRRSKFISSSLIKPHALSEGGGPVPAPDGKRKAFAQGLLKKIRKAAQQSSDFSS